MPAPPPPKPVAAPPPARRKTNRVSALFRAAVKWVYYLPRPVQYGFILFVILSGVAAGVFVKKTLAKRAVNRELLAANYDFQKALGESDIEGMQTALDRILAADPNDIIAARRKVELTNESADADDPVLASLFVNRYLAAGKIQEAAREAATVRKTYPHDWRSICVQAHAALLRGDRAGAENYLNQFADPEDAASRVDVNGLLYSLNLFRQFGRDVGPIRGLIVRRLLPLYRGGAVKDAPAGTKASLIECYMEPFADPGNLAELGGFWVDVSRLADAAVDDAAQTADTAALTRLGNLGPRMKAALGLLKVHQNMSDDQYAQLAGFIDARTRKAWEEVRAKAPTQPAGYLGLARIARAEKRPADAERLLVDGVRACGLQTDLVGELTAVLVADGRADVALETNRAVAVRDPADPQKWLLTAAAAEAAHRSDRVIEACEMARRAAVEKGQTGGPAYLTAVYLQTKHLLETGTVGGARRVVAGLFPAFFHNPDAATVFVRVQAESAAELVAWANRVAFPPWVVFLYDRFGVGPLADTLLDDTVANVRIVSAKVKRSPAPVLAGVLRGVLDARPYGAARAAKVAAHAAAVLRDEPNDAVRWVRADALARQAEYATPPWPTEVVREAVRTYNELPSETRADFRVVAAVARLQLKGLKDATEAARTAAPLKAAAADPALSPAQLEVLGEVYLAQNDPVAAVGALRRAAAAATPRAGIRIQLAVALHRAGRPADARAVLEQAQYVSQSPGEQADWAAAAKLLSQESP